MGLTEQQTGWDREYPRLWVVGLAELLTLTFVFSFEPCNNDSMHREDQFLAVFNPKQHRGDAGPIVKSMEARNVNVSHMLRASKSKLNPVK